MPIAIVVHGGASTIAPEEEQAYRDGCLRALEAGWQVLERGGGAMEAVEVAIRALEADPTFDAGLGSALNAAGEVELCAGMMEGAELKFGAVAVAQGLPHPISVARMVLETYGTQLLAGRGAEQFAEAHGAERCDPAELITEEQRGAWAEDRAQRDATGGHDTVGSPAAVSTPRSRSAPVRPPATASS